MTTELDLRLVDECAEFYADPLGYVLWAYDWGHGELAGFKGPDVWQREFLEEIGRQVEDRGFDGVHPVKPQRYCTTSGHGIGKSTVTAWLTEWLMATRPHCKGRVTANTSDQLRTGTWAEVGKWRKRSLVGHWFEYTSGKGSMAMYHKSYPESWRVDALTSREENSEAFAGQHAVTSSSFYIFDEASAVPDKIWEVAEGGMTDGEPFFFAFGNPTRNTGAFKRCFASDRWTRRRVDSRTSALTNKAELQAWADEWGEDSDFFRVRVRGEFPRASDMQFMPSDIVGGARERSAGLYIGDEPLICGFDVSRGGNDNCVITFRRGKDAKSDKTYILPGEKARDSMRVVSVMTMILDRHKPDVTFVDETGIGGPLCDRLVQLGYNAIGVGFGWKADDEKHFADKASEMAYRCREWLMHGGAIIDSAQLEEELTCREYSHNHKDQLVIESKKQVKKRIGVSPDLADALYLTFAQHVAPIERRDRDRLPGQRSGADAYDYDPLDAMD